MNDATLPTTQTICPLCASPMPQKDYRLSDLVACTTCGAELEVVSLEPLRFEEPPEVEEDWGE